MSLYKNVNNTGSFPVMVNKWVGVGQGYGPNTAVNYANGTSIGSVWGISANLLSGNTVAGNKYGGPGWVKVNRGRGGVKSITISAAGSGYANGQTLIISNGYANGVATLTTNATGNVTAVAVTNGGQFFSTNVSLVAFTATGEKSLQNITVSGTPTGYSNSDTIVVSNGTVNATATLVTNATGGFVTGNVTITNPGLFSNTAANTSAVFTVVAANGGVSAGSGATFTANLGFTGTGLTVAAASIGGRAGRVQSEVLVAMSSMTTANQAADYANLP